MIPIGGLGITDVVGTLGSCSAKESIILVSGDAAGTLLCTPVGDDCCINASSSFSSSLSSTSLLVCPSKACLISLST